MRVQHKTLNRLAGIVWLIVGLGLATAGLRFILGWNVGGQPSGPFGTFLALSIGGLIGVAKGHFVLARTARRNRKRIAALQDPRIWQVFTGLFAIMILLMMGAGRGLRFLAANGWMGGYLGVGGIYVGIGLALIVASRHYFLRSAPALATRIEAAPSSKPTRRGVLLVNLGSPDAPTTSAVRRFLRQFLGDPRVVETNRVLWAFVLNVMILPFRSGKSAALYRNIWTDEGSPLLIHGRRLRDELSRRLGEESVVVLGMRYGSPSLDDALDEFQTRGCEEIVVLSLFPQYSNTTTGSVVAEVNRLVALQRHAPNVRFVQPFYDHPLYIEAVAQRAEACDAGDFTVFSFHGMPESYIRRGDPYLEQCGRTAWALAERLGLARDQWEMVFQSRFGDEPWLQPYLDEFVPGLAKDKPRIRVIAPSFTADCLETVEEIGMRLREDFHKAGGQELIVVPCLNSDGTFVDALETMVGQVRNK